MKLNRFLLTVLLVVCSPVNIAGPGASAQDVMYGDIIEEILVEGNKGIEAETILFVIRSSVGERMLPEVLQQDIKALYDTGFFEDVRIEAEPFKEGVRLIYVVQEKPILKAYEITGAKKLSSSTLQSAIDEAEVELAVPSPYDPVAVEKAANAIRNKYREDGYNYVTVTPLINELGGGAVTVNFAVNEGDKVRIREIEILGDEKMNEGNRFWGLKSKLKKTREHWFLSWLTGGGKYQQDLLNEDLQNLENHYQNKGFADASVGKPDVEIKEIRKEKLFGKGIKTIKVVSIKIPVIEGEQYRFGEIDLEGAEVFPEDKLLGLIGTVKKGGMFKKSIFTKEIGKLEEGDVYNRELVQTAIQNITDLYGSRGRIYSVIYPDFEYDHEKKLVNILFQIEEGEKIYLNRLEFKGNLRTRDKVLRREIPLTEGDVFNTMAFRLGVQKIHFLGYIQDIVPDVQPAAAADELDVVVSVNDTHPTELQLSGGYSSADKLFGTFGISEHNLFGRGQELNFQVTASKIRTTFQLKFSDDWLFDTRTHGSISLWNQDRTYELLKKRSRGGSIFGGRPLFWGIAGRLGYSYELNKIYDREDESDSDIDDDNGSDTFDSIYGSQDDRTTTSSITQYFFRDRRDNQREPTRGTYNRFSFEYAGGFLGGTNDFYKLEYEASIYIPLGKLVWLLHAEIDYADGHHNQVLPYFERYFLGGSRTVRGFREDSIGPKDSYGNNLGGNKALLFNTELIIPIAGPLKAVLFFDAGDAYADDASYDLRTMRPGAGVEIRFFVPQFWVPLRFIWGYNLDRYQNEDLTEFQFTLGTFF